MSNYLIYPTKVQNITQNYNNSYTHKPHTTGNIKDYPIDEACADSGRSYMYCPCDEMKIVKIYGVGNGGTNTIWLQSTSKVNFADGTTNYVTIMVTHPNDDTLKNLRVGQTFKRKAAMFLEGTDGNATGNHFHISVGKGTMTEGGWAQNNNGKWVLRTSAGTCKPEAAFYVDTSFTSIQYTNGITFKKLSDASKTQSTTSKTSTTKTDSFFPSRGYFKKGDESPNIGKITKFMRENFSLYTNKNALGNIYGPYAVAAITEFQKRTGLTPDGLIGPKTVAKLETYGFQK